jgi:type VII secretion protein EccB
MARQPATRLDVSAKRFLVRRMTHALVRRNVVMHDDPLRAQSLSLATGSVLAALVVVVVVVLGLVRPQGLPNSPIVMARESGALYVRIDDVLHPVLNLASARLVARSAANPDVASEEAVARSKRGPLVGIPGAPATLGTPVGDEVWSVCDDGRTVVAVGDRGLDGLEASRPLLVTPRGESAATTYLIYDGHRAEVDLRNVAVVRALRLDDVEPVAVSRTLLDVVPEAPAITPPPIAGFGDAGPSALAGVPVGSVIRVRRADLAEHYVVLRDGIQLIGDVAADVIRFTYDRRAEPIVAVAPTTILAVPTVVDLPVATFPRDAGTPVGAREGRIVCAVWRPGSSLTSDSNTSVRYGDSSQHQRWDAASLAQADGEGPNVDAVALPPGSSAYVRSARVLGDDGVTGARFLLTDGGVLFGVHDDDAAKFLGLEQRPAAAPWPVLAHLPRGPELSTDAASVLRDGLPTPS